MGKSENIVWSAGFLSKSEREQLTGHKGCVVWLTGLSGSGKSTIAKELELSLVKSGNMAYILDGDNIRHGLNSDLGFSDDGRDENIRRIGEVAALFADAGVIAITAFISPFAKGREQARRAAGNSRFFEVFLDVPLHVCEARDPKGLYGKARKGEISNFTGIDSVYEKPHAPELVLDTSALSVEDSVKMVILMLKRNNFIEDER
ncbi:MAG: adenylyl-sulfate kinase [Victivallales bacterium]|nr:adenylyl-sulfate kinase [Victivallales bacterium]